MKTKFCTKCKKRKSLDDFHKNRRNEDGLQTDCKLCRKNWHKEHYKSRRDLTKPKFSKAEWQRNWRAKNPEKYKAVAHKNRLKKRYGMTPADYDQMFIEQDGKCIVCGIDQNELNHTLCVDHNHKTGKVRQLVCKRCNLFIGIYETGFYGLSERIKFYLEMNNAKE